MTAELLKGPFSRRQSAGRCHGAKIEALAMKFGRLAAKSYRVGFG